MVFGKGVDDRLFFAKTQKETEVVAVTPNGLRSVLSYLNLYQIVSYCFFNMHTKSSFVCHNRRFVYVIDKLLYVAIKLVFQQYSPE